jgi:large subunit ribosomal protein L17
MYRNLVTDLLRYEKIVTTEAKAKEVRGMVERMITLGKDGTLPSRRRALAFVTDKKVVVKLFDELAPRYAQRPGGYTRIAKLGPRLGDGAPMAQLELVE